MRLPDPDPKALAKFHFVAMVIWAGPLLAATVFWWKESILWVGLMSVYACAVGHFSGWDAARAEMQAKDG